MCKGCDAYSALFPLFEKAVEQLYEEEASVLFAKLILGASEDPKEVMIFLGHINSFVLSQLGILDQIESTTSTHH